MYAGEPLGQGAEVPTQIEATMALEASSPSPAPAALVIDGKALTYALSKELSPAFLRVGLACKAVVCCRVSPLQKAQVTGLVRGNGAITLAIGDGANDVGMIQRAHIGVGISGQEGMQAVMSADFAIAQFRFLTPLLLVHGQYSYKRLCRMICFFFYKNMLFGTTLFAYSAFTRFSGSYIYNDTSMTLFNVLFTSATPLLIGMFDRPLGKRLLLRFPQLYQRGVANSEFSPAAIAGWLLAAVGQAGVILVLVLLGCSGTTAQGEGGMPYGMAQGVCGTLLLLESGQAVAARQRVERYMALLVAAAPRKQPPQQPPLEELRPPQPPLEELRPRKAGVDGAVDAACAAAPAGLHLDAQRRRMPDQRSRQSDPQQQQQPKQQQEQQQPQQERAHAAEGEGGDALGGSRATWQDRAALARLYSQDVLVLGLGLPGEALRWLGAGPAQQQQQQTQQQQQQQGAAVVTADDLLAGCSEDTVAGLRLELQQQLEAAGLGGGPEAGGGLASAAPARGDVRSLASAAATAGAATGAAGRPAGCPARAESLGSGRHTPPPHTPAPSVPRPGTPPVRRPGVAAVLRAWLAALRAALRRLASAAAARLTAAQAWSLCAAAAALSRLRASAAALAPGLAPSGSGAHYARHAAALAVVAGLLVLAAQAEAPHLRAALKGRVVALAGMVGEALRMGLALHPSPVAGGAAY
ncbi:putative phospholipid-transporting ATPase 8 [Tetrabaena socialis]|uniref:Putative phospholipid-transporting ATPase 8 n=1 Tax=Tetrabaena socialis TaxID=47790 RepID=A0A2J7ZYQ2_9CHLO|nr:putative phospholipid-transporting ATPase 8 [Tetrabaena socialis]|eukprot:PNH05392.1 putative phospholipid-transporting ATPase 8 [Tetrabaena socialis]